MKTTINILRSIFTSLLFLILTIALIIQFIFTAIHLSEKTLPDIINPQTILEAITQGEQLDEPSKKLAINYIEEYKNYVFYKRSFPSVQPSPKNDEPNEQEKINTEQLLTNIRNKIDMKYETVLTLRNINNFLSNGAIYLLINIGLFVIILLIWITTTKISKTFKLTGISMTISGLLFLFATNIGITILTKHLDPLSNNFIKDLFSNTFLRNLQNQALVYIALGFFLFLTTFTIQRFLIKKQTQN